MGFKSIELQVAIPRSQDAGKMQEQMMKQGQQFQDTLTNNRVREELLKRTQVNEYDHVEKQTVNEDDERNQSFRHEQEANEEDSDDTTELDHPYLGKNVDFSG